MEPIIATIGDTIEMGAAADYIPLPWDPLRPLKAYQKRVEHKAAVKIMAAQKKAAAPAVIKDPVLNKALAAGKIVHSMLSNAGLSEPAASFGTYASYHETGAFNSPLFLQHNNGSGIKFAGQKGAVKGSNGYAWFPNGIQDWAAAYKHELTKGSNPAGAATVEDFAARLKANRYFEDTVDNYLHGIKRARLVLSAMPAAEWNYNQDTDYNTDTGVSTPKPAAFDLGAEWRKLATWQKGGIIGLGTLVVIGIIKR